MAFTNQTVTSFLDCITKIDTWMKTVGWTGERLDTASVDSNSGEWAMRRTAGATNIRFAAKWDALNTPDHMAIYNYVDQNYVEPDRPYGQDHDSGNGAVGNLDATLDNARYARIGTAPTQFWGFEGEGPNGSAYTYIVVQVAADEVIHFGFGLLDKNGGDWTGGEFAYGHINSPATSAMPVRDGNSWLLDGLTNDAPSGPDPTDNMELFVGTIHAEALPNGPAGGLWAVSMGGKQSSPQTDFGTDRQSNDGSSADADRVMFTWGLRAGPWANAFYRQDGSGHSGQPLFWRIATTYVDGIDIHGLPMGFMPNAFGFNIKDHVLGDTVVDENGDTFYLFPARKKQTGAEAGTSGLTGVAYKVPIDPLLPAEVNDPSGWWSSRDSRDYTLSGTEVTQLNDKSGNLNHLLNGDHSGPDVTTIDGRTWMDFVSATPNALNVSTADTDPASGDYSAFVVYRSTSTARGTLVGKLGAGNPHYGLFVGENNSRSLYSQIREDGGDTGEISAEEHDNVSFDYTDGTTQMVGMNWDGTGNTLVLHGADWSTTVGSTILALSDGPCNPSNDLFIGVWDTAGSGALEGQIAEVILFTRTLTATERTRIQDWLKDKWGIA